MHHNSVVYRDPPKMWSPGPVVPGAPVAGVVVARQAEDLASQTHRVEERCRAEGT
jgi:hypothetical protein